MGLPEILPSRAMRICQTLAARRVRVVAPYVMETHHDVAAPREIPQRRRTRGPIDGRHCPVVVDGHTVGAECSWLETHVCPAHLPTCSWFMGLKVYDGSSLRSARRLAAAGSPRCAKQATTMLSSGSTRNHSAEREISHRGASRISGALHDLILERVLADAGESGADLLDESVAETGLAGFVVVLRVSDVPFGQGSDSNRAAQGAG
jgi:hypothetical protein